jgi:uncharacterized membrane protein YvbJ
MFCPKCGQQQTSEEIRFCSRCGVRLSVIRDLLSTDSVVITDKTESPLPTLVSLIMFIAALLAVAASLVYVGPASHQMVMFSLIAAAITFVFLLSCRPWRLIHKLFSEDAGQINQVSSATSEHALPPAQSIPATEFSTRRVNTAEMVQPPSITEHTTRLLDTERN